MSGSALVLECGEVLDDFCSAMEPVLNVKRRRVSRFLLAMYAVDHLIKEIFINSVSETSEFAYHLKRGQFKFSLPIKYFKLSHHQNSFKILLKSRLKTFASFIVPKVIEFHYLGFDLIINSLICDHLSCFFPIMKTVIKFHLFTRLRNQNSLKYDHCMFSVNCRKLKVL